jgi:flagellar biosynthetic protein FlhB
MAGEKTEKPTQKKLRDARKKGQIPRSRDLAVAAGSLATTLALAQWGTAGVVEIGQILTTALQHFGDGATGDISEGDLAALTFRQLSTMTLLSAPVAIAAAVAGVGAFVLQGGITFTTENLTPDISKLSPAKGLKRLGFQQSGLDTIKTLIVAAVISYLSWTTVTEVMDESLTLAFLAPGQSAITAGGYMQTLLTRIGWALLILAAADYGLQRYRSRSQLMMSKQEVRDESKESEGNAEVKGRVRRIQREMAKRRMLNDVSRATVVITNPTHFAVALEYRRGVMPAPKVLAKGVDQMALRIRERAKKHGIPMIENRPLARALHDGAEVGQTIPADLFSAVAEVLAQLIRLKQLWL